MQATWSSFFEAAASGEAEEASGEAELVLEPAAAVLVVAVPAAAAAADSIPCIDTYIESHELDARTHA